MKFYFTEKVKVRINMDNYVEIIIDWFPRKISKIGEALTQAGNNIFFKGNSKRLGKKETE